jgi:hypothetical protein
MSGGKCVCHLILGVCVFLTVQLLKFLMCTFMHGFVLEFFVRGVSTVLCQRQEEMYLPKLDITCAHIQIYEVQLGY